MRCPIISIALLIFLSLAPAAASAPRPGAVEDPGAAPDSTPERLTVATFNIWVGGQRAHPDKEQSIIMTTAAMRAIDADILAIQEQSGLAQRYADALGYSVLVQGGSTAILTRLEIIEPSPAKFGARLRSPSGATVWVYNIHFPAAPYQPYQLDGIEYFGGRFITTPEEAITEARLARGDPALRCLRDIDQALRDPGALVILCGDFNEPSCEDWTPASVKAWNRIGPIDWPTTRMFKDAGMTDAFRELHPDPVAKPGWTWTPLTLERTVMDRIDLVLYASIPEQKTPVQKTPEQINHNGSPRWRPIRALVVGEQSPAGEQMSDMIVEPWPSDHRAVLIEFERERAP